MQNWGKKYPNSLTIWILNNQKQKSSEYQTNRASVFKRVLVTWPFEFGTKLLGNQMCSCYVTIWSFSKSDPYSDINRIKNNSLGWQPCLKVSTTKNFIISIKNQTFIVLCGLKCEKLANNNNKKRTIPKTDRLGPFK